MRGDGLTAAVSPHLVVRYRISITPQCLVGVAFQPRITWRSVSLARKVSVVVSWRFRLSAWISAQLPAVVAANNLRYNLSRKVFPAFFTEQLCARHNNGSFEYRRRPAIGTFPRLHWGRLTFPAHGVANPTSSSHRYRPPFNRAAISRTT